MNQIYLDACSTTPLDPRVTALMIECFEAGYVNPASQHRLGQQAASRLEQARQQIRDSLQIGGEDRLIFTSGGTEANNLALFGYCHGGAGPPLSRPRPNIVVSAIEHPGILSAAAVLENRGWEVRFLPVDHQGLARIDVLQEIIDEQTQVVSLMLVNNETGVIQPIGEAAETCARRNVPLHCDAVQAIGKIPVPVGKLFDAGLTAMTLTAHKLHGPRGIGALVLKGAHQELAPMMFGGFQQLGLRPGTEDVTLGAGFAEAVQLATGDLDSVVETIGSLRDMLEKTVAAAFPDLCIIGSDIPRAPHCSCIAFPGDETTPAVERQPLMLACDMAGVALSTGSACASGSSDPSHVLQAMGLDSRVIEGSIRVSFSRLNTMAECGEAADRIIKAVKHLRQAKTTRK